VHDEGIVSVAAVEGVVSAADENVVAGTAGNGVVARAGDEEVVPEPAGDRVVTVPAVDDDRERISSRGNDIVASPAKTITAVAPPVRAVGGTTIVSFPAEPVRTRVVSVVVPPSPSLTVTETRYVPLAVGLYENVGWFGADIGSRPGTYV